MENKFSRNPLYDFSATYLNRRARSWNWKSELKFEIENWDWKLELKIVIENWNWKLRLKIDIKNRNWQLTIQIKNRNWKLIPSPTISCETRGKEIRPNIRTMHHGWEPWYVDRTKRKQDLSGSGSIVANVQLLFLATYLNRTARG